MKLVALNEPIKEEKSHMGIDINLLEYRKIADIDTSLAPDIVVDIVSTLKYFYKGVSLKIIFNTVIPKLAQPLTALRIKYKEVEGRKAGYPNWYSINLMPSGFGKDRMLDDIGTIFLADYKKWFYEKAENYKQTRYKKIEDESFEKFPPIDRSVEKQRFNYIKDESNKVRNLVSEISEGTREGVSQDAKGFFEAGFGSLFIKHPEFGSFLYNSTQEQKLFLDMLNEAYSGKIISKSIKGENREANIEDLPVNLLFHADTTLFERDSNKIFETLLQNGFGRRCSIIAQYEEDDYIEESDAQKARLAEKRYCKSLEILGKRFFETFSAVQEAAIFELTEEGYSIFHQYKIKLKKSCKNEKNTLMAKEINSRQLKALKLSGLYACLNHPLELYIYPQDMIQAINTIDFLGSSFKIFLNHKAKYKDKYDKIFDFFLENEEKEFTKTELIVEHHREFGHSRDKFRASFDKYIEMVKDIAGSKGYVLQETLINNNSGRSYSLRAIKCEELSDGIPPLEDLI